MGRPPSDPCATSTDVPKHDAELFMGLPVHPAALPALEEAFLRLAKPSLGSPVALAAIGLAHLTPLLSRPPSPQHTGGSREALSGGSSSSLECPGVWYLTSTGTREAILVAGSRPDFEPQTPAALQDSPLDPARPANPLPWSSHTPLVLRRSACSLVVPQAR